jgi:pimeloyl-ACP methyl ester carboxylesterase
VATYALIHAARDVGWYWHLVAAELRELGHDAVAPDLPCDDDSAGLWDYAQTVIDAIGEPGENGPLVVAAQSAGAFTAPLVCERLPVELLVLVAGLVPLPGEVGRDWWTNTGYEPERGEWWGDDRATFYHDVPPDLAAEAMRRGRVQSDTPTDEPWPLQAWPGVPTRFLLCLEDRLLPADFLRGVVKDRLGIVPDEIHCGHCAALSRPQDVADRLDDWRAEQVAAA